VSGNHEVSNEPRTARDIDSIINRVRIRMRVYGALTIYKHEVERTNLLGRHHRGSTSSQIRSRLLRAIHGVHEVRTAHVPRVFNHRSTLLMMFSAICIFTVSLTIIIFTAVALTD